LYRKYFKRLLDIVLGALLLVLVLPLILTSAMVILIAEGRPVLISQDRLGRGGKLYKLYKLRTMHEEQDGPPRPCSGMTDSRVTGTGRWLRAMRLDELPQLVNVLRGDMSLVGPRPDMVEITFNWTAATGKRRHRMKPGITGLAKVNAPNRPIDDPTSVDDDLLYGRICSFWLDLKILSRTLWAVWRGIREQRAERHQPGTTTPATDEAPA
jgi:lipopolysaccharide/colanic/teichoic acid biosynthesis glycosyltransferase